MIKIGKILICTFVFAIVLAAGITWTQTYRDKVDGEQRLLLEEIVDAQAKSIERRLSQALLAAKFLAIEVQRHNKTPDDFEQLAQSITESVDGVTNLQLAPGGVISDIYPLEGHEAALGLDVLNHPTSARDARRAIEQRSLSLAGPIELVQGGQGIIGRYPVFFDVDGENRFWGLSSVLITLEDLLAKLDLVTLADEGYAYRLSQIDSNSGQSRVFASSKMPLTGNTYRDTIPLADTTWVLEVSRDSEAIFLFHNLGYVIALLVAFSIALALYFLLRQNEVLREAHASADRANRERNRFMISMSHEIRTPLTGLLGVIHLLKRTGLDPAQRRYVETASTTGNMLLTVINDLLDLSRVDSDDFALESVLFELTDLIEDVASVAAISAHSRGVDLVCDIDHGIPHRISGDPQRLRQVLNNLLGNAIAQVGSGQVLISARPVGAQIEIAVEINQARSAPGEAGQSRGAGATSSPGFDGLEQGMLISRRWIEAMGSELLVTRQASGEARYHFRLDIDPDQADPYDWKPPVAMRDFSVCVLSPNPARRQSLLRTLHHWNIDRTEERAFDPETDQPPADAEPCDLVIVDQVASNEKVAEFIGKMRNSAAWRETRFIQLVPQGGATEGSIADLCLHKPVFQSKLYSAMMEMLYRISLDSEFRQEVAGAEPGQEQPLRGRRLLLAEDNDINKIVALEILEETGAAVDVAVNGAEAVAMAGQTDYDLILMDIQMPEIDGYEATRQIRALNNHYSSAPIVAMTAHAQEHNRSMSSEAGMDQHISKPFDPDQLLRLVVGLASKRDSG